MLLPPKAQLSKAVVSLQWIVALANGAQTLLKSSAHASTLGELDVDGDHFEAGSCRVGFLKEHNALVGRSSYVMVNDDS
jgi:hypothetical protein